MRAVAQSDKQKKNTREKDCRVEKRGNEGRKRGCRFFPWRWRWRQANPIPEIITHSDEEVNEIDLNVL